MRESQRSLSGRIALAAAIAIGAVVVALLLAPEALPILPAVLGPLAWVMIVGTDRPTDPKARRVLLMLSAAGVVTFALGVVACVLAS